MEPEKKQVNKEKELLSVLKRIDKYFFGNFNKDKTRLKDDDFIFSNFSKAIKELYNKPNEDSQKKYLNYFLNNGIPSEELDLFNFYLNNLRIYYGFYTFIDPYNLDEKDAKPPLYLWGKSSYYSPSFQLKWVLSSSSTGSEIISPNEYFFHFYISLNEFLRNNTTFSEQDYVRIFNNEAYSEKRNTQEKEKDFLYIPSSEIDHCILQYLIIYLKKFQLKELSIIAKVEFDVLELGSKDLLSNFLDDFENKAPLGKEIIRTYFESSADFLLIKSVNNKTSESIKDWFYSFGYLTINGFPTPRFRAAMEYFYFLLEDQAKEEQNTNFHPPHKYLELIDHETFSNSEYIFSDFQDTFFYQQYCNLLNTQGKQYWENMSSENWEPIIESYLEILFSWQEMATDSDELKRWQNRCRFGVLSHFFQRCIINSFHNIPNASNNSLYFEHTCKGILIIPILNNTRSELSDPSVTKRDENKIRHWGYFMCIVNDSDSNGRCFFNWYREADNQINPDCEEFYRDTFYRIKVFAKHLGAVETSYIFYEKIITGHIESISQAERIKTFTSISNSTHTIKTLVQRVLRPKATFLLGKLEDESLKKYQEKYVTEIDELIQLGELINISSKLVTSGTSGVKSEIIKSTLAELNKISIISTGLNNSLPSINLSEILNELIKLHNDEIDYYKSKELSTNYTKINELIEDINVSTQLSVFGEYNLTPFFFKIFCATVIENHIKHGINKSDFSNKLSIEIDDNLIKIITEKSKTSVEKCYYDTGVFGALNLIFKHGLSAFEISHYTTTDKKHILELKKY